MRIKSMCGYGYDGIGPDYQAENGLEQEGLPSREEVIGWETRMGRRKEFCE